jgi:hypothetical protein
MNRAARSRTYDSENGGRPAEAGCRLAARRVQARMMEPALPARRHPTPCRGRLPDERPQLDPVIGWGCPASDGLAPTELRRNTRRLWWLSRLLTTIASAEPPHHHSLRSRRVAASPAVSHRIASREAPHRQPRRTAAFPRAEHSDVWPSCTRRRRLARSEPPSHPLQRLEPARDGAGPRIGPACRPARISRADEAARF